ncbi:hypothetical protein OAH77_05140, partial [Flavobacteriaceae bacterium]|nr:hypothetical protein [Flavobacteriaceae bacterium]
MKIIPINQVVNIAYCFKRYLIGLLFLIGPLNVSAQDVSLFEQFNGQYDFTAIGNTLNTGANACNILTQSSANLTLTGNQDLVAARLYWSGSGGDLLFPADNNVTLNGTDVSAERTFTENSVGLTFFGAYADVTDIVAANGNGTYTLSNLDLTNNIYNPPGPNNSSQYCNQTVDYGGWSIIIIYEEDGLALNQISLFDGLEVVYQNELTITLGPLNVASDQLAKIGFLAWEGDLPNPNNESLRINNILVDDPPLNPGDNQFNSTNTYTNSTNLFNMDLDAYNLEGLYDIEEGDEEIEIKITSDSDLILINNIITSVNSELPDASIIFEPIEFICNDTVDVNWTVFNVNSTGALPAGVPIKFYLEGAQIAQDNTTTTIPIDGAETGTVTLTIPTGTVADPFTIIAVVDDGGGGVSTVDETNEGNNEYDQEINLADVTLSVVLNPDILIANNDAICDGADQVIGIDSLTPPGATATYQWFFNGAIIPGATNEDLTVTQAGTYTLEVTYQGCDTTDEIIVEFVANPIAGTPTPLVECDEVPNDGIAEFTLSDADTDIIAGQPDTFVTYYETEDLAITGDPLDALASPFTNITADTQTIFARLEENVLGCYDVTQLVLIVDAAPTITDSIENYLICDNDQDNTEIFDLTSKYDEIVNTLPDITLTYYNTEADANAAINAITSPDSYTSPGGETIWISAVNLEGCITIGSFNLVLGTITNYVEVPIIRICDDSIFDGFTDFDLDSQIPIITAGDPNLTVTYHLTEADAEAGTIPSLTSPYTNIVNPEVIWVRVEDNTTTCYVHFEILLDVQSTIAGTPGPLVECDQLPNDGFDEFNLTDADTEIINGQAATAVRYFETEALAIIGNPLDALASPYTNITIDTQTIYARIENV